MFIICAFSIPFLYPSNPGVSADTDRRLALTYDFFEEYNSSTSGLIVTQREDTLTTVVTMNNMIVVLSTQYYCEVPLGKNVESWDIGNPVRIGGLDGNVIDSEYIVGYDCWTCHVEDGTVLSYDKGTGVLVQGVWQDIDFDRTIVLMEMNFIDPPRPLFLVEAFILSGIFLELAIVVWFFVFRSSKDL